MIYNILVAIDGSKAADKAFDVALDLAETYSANLVIVNIIQNVEMTLLCSTPTGAAISLIGMDSYIKGLKARHEAMLTDVLKKAKKHKPHVSISTKLEFGQPASKIVSMAKLGNFDLIVLGHRGLSSVREFFLGGVSHRVANNADCSVMIVK